MRWRLPIVGLVLLLVAGCGKLTAENYGKLKVGMSYQEVTGILGGPAGCDQAAGLKHCTWGDEKRNIRVQFAADRALLFSAQGIR
ncbi:MAG: DUF3862 domain-containing protein [Candidatus Methylomirabilota bacterium]